MGETPTEISEELNIGRVRIMQLRQDPLFAAELNEMQNRANEKAIELSGRLGAREILDGAADAAAQVCADAAQGHVLDMNGEKTPVSPKLQLMSARDILDRTGYKPVDKKLVGSVDVGKLISDAYKKGQNQDRVQSTTDESITDIK